MNRSLVKCGQWQSKWPFGSRFQWPLVINGLLSDNVIELFNFYSPLHYRSESFVKWFPTIAISWTLKTLMAGRRHWHWSLRGQHRLTINRDQLSSSWTDFSDHLWVIFRLKEWQGIQSSQSIVGFSDSIIILNTNKMN